MCGGENVGVVFDGDEDGFLFGDEGCRLICGFFLLLIVDGVGPPSPSPDYVCVLAVPDDFRMSKYPGGPSSSSGNSDSIVSASPSAKNIVAIRSRRILLLSRL